MRKPLILFIIIVLLLLFGYIAWPYIFDTPNQVACTMEAKLCPDGSAVGRTGPNCEFAKCPGE